MDNQPALLRLPLELRHQIYAHLIYDQVISHPIRGVGITSVSHRPPSPGLLLIHPSITQDVQDYYFSVATWKLIFSHAFNFFRIDPTLSGLAKWKYLTRIQKVEVVFFCDILLLKEYPSFGLDKFCAEIRRRAGQACDILAASPDLRKVTISWIDTTMTGAWQEKAKIVEPLGSLRGRVELCFGQMEGPNKSEMPDFIRALASYLGIEDYDSQDRETANTLQATTKLSHMQIEANE